MATMVYSGGGAIGSHGRTSIGAHGRALGARASMPMKVDMVEHLLLALSTLAQYVVTLVIT